MRNLNDSLEDLSDSVDFLSYSVSGLNDSMNEQLTEHKKQTATTDAVTKQMNTKLNTLISNFSQHQQQTAAESAQFQTSFTQLHQNVTNNLTHQLETIGDRVDRLYDQRFTCGGTGGWRRVVYLDMTDPCTICPSGWQLTGYSKRTCGKATHTGSNICDSATFPVIGGEYSRVCGRIKAYQFGGIDAFEAYNIREGLTINDAYVSGISLTYGSPREHIWTFAAGATDGDTTTNWICPCDATVNIDIPPFVNQDYFCETAIRGPWIQDDHNRRLFTSDPLWDGEGCGTSSTCCEFNGPPYFTKQLSSPTTDNIEARICIHQPAHDNVAVELLELFVQ